MPLEEQIVAALTANADGSWSWLDRVEPAVLIRRAEPGSSFAANIVVIKNIEGATREIEDGVLFASHRQTAGIVRERVVRVSVERGVTITQESLELVRDSESVAVTSSAVGSDLQPTADLIEFLVHELTREST